MIDTHHTPHFALGYLFDKVQPRIGMATHLEYEAATYTEVVAGVRAHFDGLFVLGAPSVQAINVTPDAVWAREAVLPELGAVARPSADQLAQALGGELPDVLHMPGPRIPRDDQQDPYLRGIKIDPSEYMPPMLHEISSRNSLPRASTSPSQRWSNPTKATNSAHIGYALLRMGVVHPPRGQFRAAPSVGS